MSYIGKLELKLKAQKLRKQGVSIKEIQKRLEVSRSSVSLWVRDIRLTNKQLKKLYFNKRTGALRGSIIAARNKIEKRNELTQRLKQEGIREIGIISQRDRFIAGVSMYLGEGGKTDRSVQISNSDPKVIKCMVRWLRENCGVLEEKLRGSLYIHDNLDEKKAKRFWSKLTGIPLKQFTKTYIVKNNPKRLRKKKHIYGVFRVSVSNASMHRKIMGWIDGLFNI